MPKQLQQASLIKGGLNDTSSPSGVSPVAQVVEYNAGVMFGLRVRADRGDLRGSGNRLPRHRNLLFGPVQFAQKEFRVTEPKAAT